jgi:hypothetical protein
VEETFSIESASKKKVGKRWQSIVEKYDFDALFYLALLLKTQAIRPEKIPLIKIWRTITNSLLKEAKDIIEDLHEQKFLHFETYYETEEKFIGGDGWKDFLKDCEEYIPYYYEKFISVIAMQMLTTEDHSNFTWKYSFAEQLIKNFKEAEVVQNE